MEQQAYCFTVSIKTRKVRTPLRVVVIAFSYEEAQEALLLAYPRASYIFYEFSFHEIIYPDDWPDRREGKHLKPREGKRGRKIFVTGKNRVGFE